MDVDVSKTDYVTISYNRLYGTGSGTSGTGVDGIQHEHVSHSLIEYNNIYNHNAWDGQSNRGENAIDIKIDSNDVTIRFNKLHGHVVEGELHVQQDCYDIYIYCNLIFGGDSSGIVIFDQIGDGADANYGNHDINIWGTIIYDMGLDGISIITLNSDPNYNINIFNNTFADNGALAPYSGCRLDPSSHGWQFVEHGR